MPRTELEQALRWFGHFDAINPSEPRVSLVGPVNDDPRSARAAR
jgi:hypothetical protein